MEKPKRKATVVLLIDEKGNICLARKKQAIHHEDGEITYSLGTYNGYGGKMEEYDTTIFDTAVRELYDESGVVAKKEDLELVTRVYFYVKKEDESFEPFMDVSFFFVRVWEGKPKEGEEMGEPTFFDKEHMPYDEMMPADKALFEMMLQGKKGVYEVKLFGRTIQSEIRVLDESFE